jgi:hypothetical protein
MLKKLIPALDAMMRTVLFVLILMQEAAQLAMQDIINLVVGLAHNVTHHVPHAVHQELVPALDVLQENFCQAIMPALVHAYLLLVVQHAQILLHVSLALVQRKF